MSIIKAHDVYLEKVEAGFKTINLQEKYKHSALHNLGRWLNEEMFKEYVEQIRFLINEKKWEFLLDSFYQVIPFGTGGRRGLVGIGPNRINKWTIQASAQGHSQYLLEQYGDNAKKRGVVLTHDVRYYSQKGIYNDKLINPIMNLDCKSLAIAAAEVYAANGIIVHFFDTVKSTPELSFSIRYLNAIGGDMFSASHNLPTDNGKKVYNESGGQLIPPFDQKLVDEVTNNVKKIKTISFEDAKSKNLINILSVEIDEAYIKSVIDISLSKERNLKILYSPLHGTGITSVYPVLKKAGFDISLDKKTSNLSGAFENVTFNIPNPEIIQSFDTEIEFAKLNEFDILINSDPDADRIGIMVKHNNEWCYFNGNEIGIILTEYGVSKFKELKKVTKDSTIIKTTVTTSLISKIAKKNNISCIDDLLVGFKYIGEIMDRLEKEKKINSFILGTEESHGYIIGNYCRDKDSAAAALWLCEISAELKKQNKTLVDYLNKIYSEYGYCHNYLTEIRLLGAKGVDQIEMIQSHLRNNKINTLGKFKVIKKIDRWEGNPSPHLSKTDTDSRNVLVFNFNNGNNTQSIKVTVRPSGTEPKIKMYFEIMGNPFNIKKITEEMKSIEELRKSLEKEFMIYCYKIINVDFPERGFLLFWQLPLESKMNYFRIEPQLIELLKIKDNIERKKKLYTLLEFLGSNPVEKINLAFKEKYKKDILDYLILKK